MEAAVCDRADPGASTRVLVLGAAGHTFGLHEGTAPCTVETTFVDIDPAARRIARELLGGEPPGTTVTMDARTLLATLSPDDRFDAVIADAYTHGRSMPAHLGTREFVAGARRVLRPGGRLYENVIVDRDGAERVWESRSRCTIHSVFEWCRTEDPPAAGQRPLVRSRHQRHRGMRRLERRRRPHHLFRQREPHATGQNGHGDAVTRSDRGVTPSVTRTHRETRRRYPTRRGRRGNRSHPYFLRFRLGSPERRYLRRERCWKIHVALTSQRPATQAVLQRGRHRERC